MSDRYSAVRDRHPPPRTADRPSPQGRHGASRNAASEHGQPGWCPPAGWYNTAEPPTAHGLRTHRHRACRIYQACAGDAPDVDFLPRVSPPLPWVCPCMKNTEKNTYFYFYYTFCRTYSQTHLFTACAENSGWFLGRFTKPLSPLGSPFANCRCSMIRYHPGIPVTHCCKPDEKGDESASKCADSSSLWCDGSCFCEIFSSH